MKKVLMLVHAFPPFRSVGHSIRAVKFIKYLPALGWMPTVLTIDDRKEYEDYRKQGSKSLLSELAPQVAIFRTRAGEPSLEYLEKEKRVGQRNWLSALVVKLVGGARRWGFRNLFLPDQRVAWLPFALSRGRRIVRDEAIDVIFATCPPHSAVLAGACLKLLTGKPLVLDYRDDWLDTPWYLSEPAGRRWIERRMESWAVKTADRVIMVTDWSRTAFLNRYPSEPAEKFILIPNGCDLADFSVLKSGPAVLSNGGFTILHAGSLNDSKNWTRTPATLFHAVQKALQEQPELTGKLTLAFTGFLPERQLQLVRELGLSDVVKELGFLPKDDLLRLMKASEILLVINYENFSTLIPGKIYEYWAVGGPPILLLSCAGAASTFVEQHRLGLSVDPSDVAGIEQSILAIYRQSKTATPLRVSTAGIDAYDRKALTGKLAHLLNAL